MKCVIVNYGMGNLKSIKGMLNYIGIQDIVISGELAQIQIADRLILPGVGSFKEAMQTIQRKQIDIFLTEAVIQKKTPILGICLGMQLMGRSSTENGDNLGLGFVKGHVSKFSDSVKVPHVGFNQVTVQNPAKLYHNMHSSLDFYFTHSFRMNSVDQVNPAICHYDAESFIASYEVENIAGVQFHPELSQTNGIKLIKNFIDRF